MFIAALDVHRAFIENNPVKMAANIGLAMDWLKGRKLTEKQAGLALDSLSLVVPVISSTFASMPRMFRDTGQEAIGWLLIDEAGQAQPQHAIGAIWRAKRTVLVGDPKQLEPVSGIPSTVEGRWENIIRSRPAGGPESLSTDTGRPDDGRWHLSTRPGVRTDLGGLSVTGSPAL